MTLRKSSLSTSAIIAVIIFLMVSGGLARDEHTIVAYLASAIIGGILAFLAYTTLRFVGAILGR
jgi:hypothetical protein